MPASRRSFLSLLCAAPLLGGCDKKRSFAGSIRGAAMPVGHRLRDASVERASGPARRVDTVIVGAGPSGLSAAWRLSRLGHDDFVALDLEPQAGGTSAFGTDGVVPYPWGAHYVPVPSAENPALVALLREMGSLKRDRIAPARETELVREPEERLFVDGEWHEGLFPYAIAEDDDLAQLKRFEQEVARWVEYRDKQGRRAFTLPMRRCSDDAAPLALDQLSAAKWLEQKGITSKLVRWYVEYATRDDYGLDLERTSAWAMMFYFASRVPSAGQESADFLTWPEGNGRLVRHLAGVAGKRLELGKLVTDVVPGAEQVELSVLDVASGKLSRVVAKRVILALPKFIVARILKPYRQQRPEHLSAFTYSSWLVANLHLSRRPDSPGFGPAWDNVLYDSPSLGYVVATHQQLSDYGRQVWTYYLPLSDGDPDAARRALAEASHAELSRALVADLAEAHDGLADAIERVDVWRWGHAMVRPVPGFIWGPHRRRALAPLGRVHFAHADLSGLALFEEAQDHGVRAAEEVLRAEGHRFETLLDAAG